MPHAPPTVILMTVPDERYNHDSSHNAVFSYCFLLLALNHPHPPHPILQQTQTIFSPHCERSSFISIQNKRPNYSHCLQTKRICTTSLLCRAWAQLTCYIPNMFFFFNFLMPNIRLRTHIQLPPHREHTPCLLQRLYR